MLAPPFQPVAGTVGRLQGSEPAYIDWSMIRTVPPAQGKIAKIGQEATRAQHVGPRHPSILKACSSAEQEMIEA